MSWTTKVAGLWVLCCLPTNVTPAYPQQNQTSPANQPSAAEAESRRDLSEIIVVNTVVQLVASLGDGTIQTIVLEAGTYAFSSQMSCGWALCIDRSVTIEASVPGSVVFDAAGIELGAGVIRISSPMVKLIGVNITGGNVTGDWGGGLYIAPAGEAKLVECSILSNIALWGGGVFIGGEATFINCRIYKNAAHWGGGLAVAVNSSSSGIPADAKLYMFNSSIYANIASTCIIPGRCTDFSGWGGGLNIYHAPATAAPAATLKAVLDSCHIHDNLAMHAGAMYIWNGGGSHFDAKLVGCKVFNNRGNLSAGGIKNDGGVLTMQTSLLEKNLRGPSDAANEENLELVGGITTYVLPAIPGHWVPADMCEIKREKKRKVNKGAIWQTVEEEPDSMHSSCSTDFNNNVSVYNESTRCEDLVDATPAQLCPVCPAMTLPPAAPPAVPRPPMSPNQLMTSDLCTAPNHKIAGPEDMYSEDSAVHRKTNAMVNCFWLDRVRLEGAGRSCSDFSVIDTCCAGGDGSGFFACGAHPTSGTRCALREPRYQYTCKSPPPAPPAAPDFASPPASPVDTNCCHFCSRALPTFNQPCNWREFPELLGKAIYVLPEGSTKVTFPYKCAPGLLGGSGSTMSDHLTILCAGLCPAGYICPKEATVEKEDCPRGYYCPEGSSVARLCAPGYFGNGSNLKSADQCTMCPRGSFCSRGAEYPCPAGGFCASVGAARAIMAFEQCPVGTYNPDTGAASNRSCVKCVAGKANPVPGSSNASSCVSCREGQVAAEAGMGSCAKCEGGNFQDEQGKQECKQCTAGSYCEEGAAAPLLCEKGTYSNATNLTSPAECTPTDEGHYASTGSTNQTPCSPGTFVPDKSMGACIKCAAGTFQDMEGKLECKPCTAGSYCAEGAAAALPCKEGTYGNETMLKSADECLPCPPGSACGRGVVEPTPCSAGTVAPYHGMSTCSQCQVGKFQDELGERECKPCTPGYYCTKGTGAPRPCKEGHFSNATSLTSAANCTPTNPGFYASTGSTEQTPCSPGTVAPNANMSSCQKCKAGTFQQEVGATTCNKCKSGAYCPEGASGALSCREGRHSNATNLYSPDQCTPTEPGFYATTGSTEPTPCSPGMFEPNVGSGKCEKCVAGTFQNASGETACKECTQFSYCTEGSADPRYCPHGTEGNAPGLKSEDECTPSKPGYWSTGGERVECNKGYYQPKNGAASQKDCKQCPIGSTTVRSASVSVYDCVCTPGYYSTEHFNCSACPQGTDCTEDGVTLQSLPLRRGFYRRGPHSPEVLRCPDADANCSRGEVECWQSSSGCRGGSDPDTPCMPGLVGIFCQQCNDTGALAYYTYATAARVAGCASCDGSLSLLAGFPLFLLVLILAVAAVWRSYDYMPKLKARLARLTNLQLHVKLKLFISFYLMLIEVKKVYHFRFPYEVEQYIGFLTAVSSFGLPFAFSVMPLECDDLGGYRAKLAIYMVTPFVLICLLFFVAAGRLIVQCIEYRIIQSDPLATPADRRTPPFEARKWASETLHWATPIILKLLFFCYPMVTSMAFQAFACYSFDDGTSWLQADFSVDCDSDDHQSTKNLAVVAIILYPVGVLVLNSLLLFRARAAIRTRRPTPLSDSIRFLWCDYEPAFFWWEIVEVLRRFVLIGIFVNFPAKSGTIEQITFGVLFSLLYALLQLYAQPYMVQSDDFLAAGLSTGLAVFFITASLYKFGELTDISEINSLLSDTQKNTFVPPYLLLTFVIFISISTGFIMLGFITAIQVETERKRRLLEAAKQRFPTTKWHLADGQKFACFLSHYKIEAGAEARYLHETLNAIMDGGDQMHDAAYLDSADLADLRELFTIGIGKSEVLVLLLTDGLLTRPWCLLEIREAVVMQKPIVLLKLKTGNSFSFEESRTLMGNIATEMPKRNKWCLPELSKHLGDWSLNDMAATVLRVINEGEESAVGLNINGTANQLCAQALNLVERLAAVTDRPPVEWIRPEKRKVKRSKVKATKRQPTKRGEASLAIDEASRGKKSRGLAPGGLLSRVNLRATASDSAGYGFYIVNDSQVEPLAKRLQEAISSELRTIVCHDGDAATAEGGVDGCLRRIQMSEVVLLVQTEHVLSDPYALLHLYCALCSDLPIVCVNVEGGGYDFQDAGTYLGALATRLDEKNPGGLAKLTGLLHDCRLQLGGGDGEERTVDALQHQLADTIPHTISVVFDPKAGPNDLVGTVLDIQDKAGLLIRNLKAKKANAAKAAKVAKAAVATA